MAALVKQTYGSVAVLVNNAIYSPVGSLLAMSVTEWDKVMAVNLRGALLCIKHMVPDMVINGQGVVVNMISAPSMPYMAAYAATKQALESVTHSLAGELQGTGVCCVAFGPGMVATPGGEAAFRKLAPLLGYTYEQLTQSGVNTGYDGLIPANDVALALAHVIVCAQKYDNQTVMAPEVLELLASIHADYAKDAGGNACDASLWAAAGDAACTLAKHVAATAAEFGRLPFFARPMAHNGFKRKSGSSIGACHDLLVLAEEQWHVTVSDMDSGFGLRAKTLADRLLRMLPGLETYFREVPMETARFVRDSVMLAEIELLANERAQSCQTLCEILTKLEGI